MKYMLLIYRDEAGLQSASKAEADKTMAAYGAYIDAMTKAGVMAGADRVQ